MSDDQHPVGTLLNPRIDQRAMREYPQFMARLRSLTIAVLYEKLLAQEKLSWQWWAVINQIRLGIDVLTDWNEVVAFRGCISIEAIVDEKLRQIAAKQSIGWLLQFLGLSTTDPVQAILIDELRKRVDAIEISEPIPEWFTNALIEGRKQKAVYLGLLEQGALGLMFEEAFANMAD